MPPSRVHEMYQQSGEWQTASSGGMEGQGYDPNYDPSYDPNYDPNYDPSYDPSFSGGGSHGDGTVEAFEVMDDVEQGQSGN